MPEITLHYFDVRGRGEIIRMLLNYAGVKFTDHRVSFEEWGNMKANTPLGSLPVLELDGEKYCQSGAIVNYFAGEHGLHGANNLETLEMDMLFNYREDIITEEGKMAFAENDAKKEEQSKKLSTEVYPKFLATLAKLIRENKTNNNSDFAVGKKFSLADVIIYEGTQNMVQNFPSIIHAYPEVKDLRSRVEQVEGLRAYLKNRPVSPM